MLVILIIKYFKKIKLVVRTDLYLIWKGMIRNEDKHDS